MIKIARVRLNLWTTRMLPLSAQIAQPLKALGFTKKSDSWWRQSQDAVQVLNIQKSPFGERIYVNLGIYLKALGTETTPPERRCHVQVRLERIADPGLWNEIASAAKPSNVSIAWPVIQPQTCRSRPAAIGRPETSPQPDLTEPHPREVTLSFELSLLNKVRNSLRVEDVCDAFWLTFPVGHHGGSNNPRYLAPLHVACS